MPDHHVKGQPAALTYVRKKWGVKKDSNRVFTLYYGQSYNYSVTFVQLEVGNRYLFTARTVK